MSNIVLIGNDYSNEKKYLGPIVMGDYDEKESVWSHKVMFSVHVGVVGTVLSITRRGTGLCRRIWCLAKKGNVINDSLVDRDRTLFPTAAYQARLNQAVHQDSGQDGELLYILVPGFSRIDHGEVESWYFLTVLRSSSSSEIQSSKTQWAK